MEIDNGRPVQGVSAGHSRALWLRRIGPLVVLAGEIGVLTPFVEFTNGPMKYLANARICAGLLFALVVFLFLSSRQRGPLDLPRPATHRWPLWMALHLGLYLVFCLFSRQLARTGLPTVSSWLAGGAWVLLAVSVGLTAFLMFLPAQPLRRWALDNRGPATVALGLGLGFALLIPYAQGLWPQLHGPALVLDRFLLEKTYGEALAGTSTEGYPVLGNRRLLVQVTPECSELDALAALWILAGAVVVSRWAELRKGRVALALLAGSAVLYLLLAVRLYGLVVAGIEVSPGVCVALAHSRLGNIAFLGFAAALVAGCCRWCRRHTSGQATRSPAVAA